MSRRAGTVSIIGAGLSGSTIMALAMWLVTAGETDSMPPAQLLKLVSEVGTFLAFLLLVTVLVIWAVPRIAAAMKLIGDAFERSQVAARDQVDRQATAHREQTERIVSQFAEHTKNVFSQFVEESRLQREEFREELRRDRQEHTKAISQLTDAIRDLEQRFTPNQDN